MCDVSLPYPIHTKMKAKNTFRDILPNGWIEEKQEKRNVKRNVKGNVKGNEGVVSTSSYGLTWNLDHVLHLSTSGGHTAVVMNNGTSHRSMNPRNKKRPPPAASNTRPSSSSASTTFKQQNDSTRNTNRNRTQPPLPPGQPPSRQPPSQQPTLSSYRNSSIASSSSIPSRQPPPPSPVRKRSLPSSSSSATAASTSSVSEEIRLQAWSYCRHNRYMELKQLLNDIGVLRFITMVDVSTGNTILHMSCINNHKKIAKLCLRNGALINVKNGMGNTPLYFLKKYGHDALKEWFVRKGAE